MEEPRLNIDDLANELLASQAGPEVEPTTAPKPGSKKYLIEQIGKICEASGVPQKETGRELNRMSRSGLQALVADVLEPLSKVASLSFFHHVPGRPLRTIGLGDVAKATFHRARDFAGGGR